MARYEDNVHAIMWKVPCIISGNTNQDLQLRSVHRKKISAAF
jgi:hypothetical protein